jgi:hypothetical protein
METAAEQQRCTYRQYDKPPQHYLFKKLTSKQASRAAVSVLSLLSPKVMALKPFSKARLISCEEKSPSGPINNK